ncbi:hypothetical protein [Mycolicibacterium smegmatis]|uniref:hypothetical protein n=1 Tax=Mycolicibacterium smegmatis TaxID=1772 RepID=UPI0013009CC8|nr:hypothetical protein [Mycolicibacterium smegmatis]
MILYACVNKVVEGRLLFDLSLLTTMSPRGRRLPKGTAYPDLARMYHHVSADYGRYRAEFHAFRPLHESRVLTRIEHSTPETTRDATFLANSDIFNRKDAARYVIRRTAERGFADLKSLLQN